MSHDKSVDELDFADGDLPDSDPDVAQGIERLRQLRLLEPTVHNLVTARRD